MRSPRPTAKPRASSCPTACRWCRSGLAPLAVAIEALEPGGILAIVAFGKFGGLPDWLAEVCIEMLARQDAPPCLELPQELRRHASSRAPSVRHEYALAGLYQLAIVERAS